MKIVSLPGFTLPCFGAKCECGEWLTKWDFSEEDARAVADAEIERGRHVCVFTENRQIELPL